MSFVLKTVFSFEKVHFRVHNEPSQFRRKAKNGTYVQIWRFSFFTIGGACH